MKRSERFGRVLCHMRHEDRHRPHPTTDRGEVDDELVGWESPYGTMRRALNDSLEEETRAARREESDEGKSPTRNIPERLIEEERRDRA